MGRRRRALNVAVSDESRAGWQAFASDHDISVTALAEAVGLILGADHPPLSKTLTTELKMIARAVDKERRSRRGTGDHT